MAADCLVGRNERMWQITESGNALILSPFGLKRRLEDITDSENQWDYKLKKTKKEREGVVRKQELGEGGFELKRKENKRCFDEGGREWKMRRNR